MNLEDYMNKEIEKKKIPHWAHFYYNLDTFDIDSKKRELLDSFKKYINSFSYCADLDYYLSNIKTFAQIKATNGDSMVIKIDLMDKSYYDDGEYMSSHSITEEEYLKRLNTYKRIGSQKIYWVYVIMPFTSNRSVSLYYTFDGKFFIDNENLKDLNNANTEDFATDLARIALQIQNDDFNQEKWINNTLKQNHSFNKIDNYSFHDSGLYLNKQLVKKIH